jgi:phage pi2 protein 07
MATRRGRPAKRAKKNISGLKNQPRPASSPESPARSPSPTDSLGDYSDTEILDTMEMDSIMYLEADTDHDDDDNEADWDEIAENEFNTRLLEMVAQMEEDRLDAEDDDWIIYPGSKGDNWWDTDQLMKQIRRAIAIHNKIHPGVTALFIFDQSSAHASLAPDALRAFDMNKSNGGKQRKQHDTIKSIVCTEEQSSEDDN